MNNNLLISLIVTASLTICTSGLQAMTKARTLTQVAATYARNNKLKTTGIIIGGAIALDVLQTSARWGWHKYKYSAQIKALQDAIDKAYADCRVKFDAFIATSAAAAKEDFKNADAQIRRLYSEKSKLAFEVEEVSFICIPLLKKLVEQQDKFRDWRLRKTSKGKRS